MSEQIEKIPGGEIINGVESLDDFVIEGNGVKSRPLTDEEMAEMNQSMDDWLKFQREQEQQRREEHKQNYIDSLIVKGDIWATFRKIAEAIYNLDMGKQERTVYLR